MRLTDPFGKPFIIKAILIWVFGLLSWYRFRKVNHLTFEGLDHLRDLPRRNVLFVSNHQTYYADVTAINHGFNAARNTKTGNIKWPFYLWRPVVISYYVAAKETMKQSGVLPYLFSLAGGITIKRTWREKGQTIDREVDTKDQDKISKALKNGWMVTFPQGTTKPYAPIRKGTAHIIKRDEPVVVPVVVEGFRRAFEKKGLMFKKRGVNLSVTFKQPIFFPKDAPIEEILEKILAEIQQDKIPLSLQGQQPIEGQDKD
jgi:1-acyl-sn-glycerol-3-phosphate acyltransferase